MIEKGINIDTAMFDLRFQTPQNFAAYRQSEIDNARVPTYTQMSAIPYISNRFALKRFLGLTEEEIADNERQWREENDENITPPPTDAAGELRSGGVTQAGISSDLDQFEEPTPDTDAPEPGSAQPGQPGQTPGGGGTTPGGTGGGGQV